MTQDPSLTMIGPIGHVLIGCTFAHRPYFYVQVIWTTILWLVCVRRCADHRPVIGGALIIASGIYVYP